VLDTFVALMQRENDRLVAGVRVRLRHALSYGLLHWSGTTPGSASAATRSTTARRCSRASARTTSESASPRATARTACWRSVTSTPACSPACPTSSPSTASGAGPGTFAGGPGSGSRRKNRPTAADRPGERGAGRPRAEASAGHRTARGCSVGSRPWWGRSSAPPSRCRSSSPLARCWPSSTRRGGGSAAGRCRPQRRGAARRGRRAWPSQGGRSRPRVGRAAGEAVAAALAARQVAGGRLVMGEALGERGQGRLGRRPGRVLGLGGAAAIRRAARRSFLARRSRRGEDQGVAGRVAAGLADSDSGPRRAIPIRHRSRPGLATCPRLLVIHGWPARGGPSRRAAEAGSLGFGARLMPRRGSAGADGQGRGRASGGRRLRIRSAPASRGASPPGARSCAASP
jgi:hypothetical protein